MLLNYGVLPHSVIGNKHRSHAAYYMSRLQNLLVCLTQSALTSQSNPKNITSRTSRTWREIYSGVLQLLHITLLDENLETVPAFLAFLPSLALSAAPRLRTSSPARISSQTLPHYLIFVECQISAASDLGMFRQCARKCR